MRSHETLVPIKTFLNLANGNHSRLAVARPRWGSICSQFRGTKFRVTNIAVMVGLTSTSFYDRQHLDNHCCRTKLCSLLTSSHSAPSHCKQIESDHIRRDQQITCSSTRPLSTNQSRITVNVGVSTYLFLLPYF